VDLRLASRPAHRIEPLFQITSPPVLAEVNDKEIAENQLGFVELNPVLGQIFCSFGEPPSKRFLLMEITV
jgi:hypothetical protein